MQDQISPFFQKSTWEGKEITEFLSQHLQELEDIMRNLSDDMVDGILAEIFKTWHYNQAFRGIIQYPIYKAFEDHAKEHMQTGLLPGKDAVIVTLYRQHSAASPNGLYYHALTYEFGNTEKDYPFERVNIRELPAAARQIIIQDLHDYFIDGTMIYRDRMLAIKEGGSSKFHTQFIWDFEEHLDKLAHILFLLGDQNLQRPLYEGIAKRYNNPGNDIYSTALEVRSDGLDDIQIMANHRYAGQVLYPLKTSQRVRFFHNIFFDEGLDWNQGGRQGTLVEIVD